MYSSIYVFIFFSTQVSLHDRDIYRLGHMYIHIHISDVYAWPHFRVEMVCPGMPVASWNLSASLKGLFKFYMRDENFGITLCFLHSNQPLAMLTMMDTHRDMI